MYVTRAALYGRCTTFMSAIDGLEPKLVWKHFENISAIPRCSKHEEKIRDYIISFAKQQKLTVKTDKPGNVVVKKPATSGMEKTPTVVLQGHMDMVCEKNSDVDHDFLKDPLKLQKKGDALSATGTTLGADNGIGVSVMLALLEDTQATHGPLETLFTVDEETGLTGAFALGTDMLTGKTLLNLDSEEFGVITVGCAGGGDSIVKLPINMQDAPYGMKGLHIKVHGLRGGHSGVNVNEQRGNAVKILNRLLWKAKQHHSFSLASFTGGDKHNAIPREASALIVCVPNDKQKISTTIKDEAQDILEEIKPIDPEFSVSFEEDAAPQKVITDDALQNLLNLIYALPHGVIKMSYDIPDLVQTSTNLATVHFKENHVEMMLSSRSSIMSELESLRDHIHSIATLCKADVEQNEPYPGWKPDLNSDILALAKKIYKKRYGEDPKVEAVHAGLECGIIGEKYAGMDMISIGPSIEYMHSPQEEVDIKSVQKFYNFVCAILEEL